MDRLGGGSNGNGPLNRRGLKAHRRDINGTKSSILRNEEEDETLQKMDFTGCCTSRSLCQLEEMPPYLQFNSHVHSGYRDLMSASDCFKSLFYLHNESVNVFTHGMITQFAESGLICIKIPVAPIVYVCLFWRSMFPWEDVESNVFLRMLGWSHIGASVSPWVGSVIYHLFMNHKKGARVYHILLQLDMFGIWFTECFGALTMLSASTWCLPRDLQIGMMSLYALASAWGLHKALTAWSPIGRRMCFAPVFISRIIAFILRISSYGGGEPNVLIHVILQDLISIAGGMIGVIRIPEKWFPGKLDLFFNSHHIMHVMVVIAVYHMNAATNGDIRWIIKNYDSPQCIVP